METQQEFKYVLPWLNMPPKVAVGGIIVCSLLIAGIDRYESTSSKNKSPNTRNQRENVGYLQSNTNELTNSRILNFNNTNYLFRVSTNGVPYFEPIKGLEIEVEK